MVDKGKKIVVGSYPCNAERARASINAQIITFGSQTTGTEAAKKLVNICWRASIKGGGQLQKSKKSTC